MKRFKRFAAMLLSAAMVMTSFQVPVFADTGEEIVVGQDGSERAEDILTGAQAEPEKAAEAEEQSQAPAEEIQETPAEDTVGADSNVYVYSAAQLVSALNGVPSSAADLSHDELTVEKLGKAEVTIVMKGGSEDYVIDSGMLTEGKMKISGEIKEKTKETVKKITVADGSEDGITVSLADDVKKAELEVPDKVELTLKGGVYEFGIVNNGYLRTEAKNEEEMTEICYRYGDSIINNKEAELDGAIVKSVAKESAAVVNNKDAELTIGGNSRITATDSSAKGLESITAVKNEGTLLINSAYVQAEADLSKAVDYRSVNSCAVENNGVLSIRGGRIKSDGVAVYNTGTAEMGSSLAEDGYRVKIQTMNDSLPALLTTGSVTVYGTDTLISVYNNGFGNTPAAATTSLLGNKERFSAAGDGSFAMYGGTVYGIAYAGTNYPTLLGGTVRHDNGACVQYQAGEGENPAKQTMKAEEYCYIAKDGAAQSSWDADKKQGKTEISLDDEDLDPDSGVTKVKDREELEKAINEKKEEIQLTNSISLTKNLTISNNTVISGERFYIYDDGMITIPEGVNMVLDTSVSLYMDKENSVGISNSGNLELKEDIDQWRRSSYEITAVKNTGTFSLNGKSYVSLSVRNGIGVENTGTLIMSSRGQISVSEGIGVKNTGTFTMEGYSSVYNNGSGAAVENAGTFIMKAGTVQAGRNQKDSFAVTYTGDHLPVLAGGNVYGARYYNYLNDTEAEEYNRYWGMYGTNWDTDENGIPVIVPEKGAAVVNVIKTEGKPDTYTQGAFLDAEGGTAKDAKNSDAVINGVVQDTEMICPEVPVAEEYLVMEVDEELNDAEVVSMVQEMSGIVNVPVFGYALDSSDQTIVEAGRTGTEQDPKLHIKALKEGYAVVKILLGDTATNAILAENYIRVEVVAKDTRKNLIAENYTGNILNQTVEYNGYRIDGVDVGFEYHLKTSDASLTGGEVTLDKILSETYKVSEIRIDDQEFNEYFEIVSVESDQEGKNITYNPQSKKYSFRIKARQKDDSTCLLIDEVKAVQDIEVSAVLLNTTLQKREVFKLGTFGISVKSAAPKLPAQTVTLNRFYDMNAYYYNDSEEDGKQYLNLVQLGDVTDVVCPAGISYYETYDTVEYDEEVQLNHVITATGKKGGKVTASVRIPGYVGRYPVTYSVKVINKAPKVSLKDKTIAVNGKSVTEKDLFTYLTAKDEESIFNIANIEVIGKKESSYKVSDREYRESIWNEKTGKAAGYWSRFYLQPTRQTVDKAETVKLKITWRNTRKVKGKDYSSTVSLKISPAKGFTVKQSKDEKPMLNTKLDGVKRHSTRVYFDVTPKSYKGGRFIVTGLNGKDAAVLDYLEAGSVKEEENGRYFVEIAANASTASKGKAVKFGIDWVAAGEDGKESSVLKNQKPAVMTVSLYDASDIAVTNPQASVDLMKIKAEEAWKSDEYLSNMITASYKAKASGQWQVQSVGGRDGHLFNVWMHDGRTVKAEPKWDAFHDGKIQAGRSYEFDVVFENETGTAKTEKLTYNVKDVNEKKVKVQLGTPGMSEVMLGCKRVVSTLNGRPVTDEWGELVYVTDEYGNPVYKYYYEYDPCYTAKTSFTMYAKSPYTLDSFVIGNPDVEREGKSFSIAPYYGLTVKNVQVAGESPYEIIKFRGANGEQSQYALTFKNKKAPKPASKKDVKALESVTIEVTYTNGSKEYKSQQKFNVNVADKDLLLL